MSGKSSVPTPTRCKPKSGDVTGLAIKTGNVAGLATVTGNVAGEGKPKLADSGQLVTVDQRRADKLARADPLRCRKSFLHPRPCPRPRP